MKKPIGNSQKRVIGKPVQIKVATATLNPGGGINPATWAFPGEKLNWNK
jgi:hypothetical protein